MRMLPTVLATVLYLTPALAFGQELLPGPRERLSPPKESLPLPAPLVIGPVIQRPTAYYRVSAYEHWQHLSPDAYGRWGPRVLTTPHGTVYSATGKPYYWAPNYPTAVRGPGTLP